MSLPPVEEVAVSSWSWHGPFYAGNLFLHDVPREAARLGFRAVELNDFMLAPPRLSRLRALAFRWARWVVHQAHLFGQGKPPSPLPERLAHVQSVLAAFAHRGDPRAPEELARYTQHNLKRVRAALDEARVRCIAWTVNSDLCVSEAFWPWQRRYLHWGVAAAQVLEAPLLRLTLGGKPDMSAEVEGRVVARLAALADEAARRAPACTLVVENHWGISTDPDRLLRILDAASERANRAVGLCFDSGNLPPEARETGWARLAPRARHVHFKTYTFDSAGRETTLPYERILSLVGERCTSVSIEYEGDGEPAAGIAASRALYARIVEP